MWKTLSHKCDEWHLLRLVELVYGYNEWHFKNNYSILWFLQYFTGLLVINSFYNHQYTVKIDFFMVKTQPWFFESWMSSPVIKTTH